MRSKKRVVAGLTLATLLVLVGCTATSPQAPTANTTPQPQPPIVPLDNDATSPLQAPKGLEMR